MLDAAVLPVPGRVHGGGQHGAAGGPAAAAQAPGQARRPGLQRSHRFHTEHPPGPGGLSRASLRFLPSRNVPYI